MCWLTSVSPSESLSPSLLQKEKMASELMTVNEPCGQQGGRRHTSSPGEPVNSRLWASSPQEACDSIIIRKRLGGVTQLVECLSSIHKPRVQPPAPHKPSKVVHGCKSSTQGGGS